MSDVDPPTNAQPEPKRSAVEQSPGSAVDLNAPTQIHGSKPAVTSKSRPGALPGSFDELRDREIGEYRILRRLGVGGMAEVYLAHQPSLDRKVALKVLRKEVLSGRDDILLRRFEQEARAAAGLVHQNIVQVYGVGEDDGLHFIAQEYVRGINLKQYLSRQGPPDASVAIRLSRQIASALKVAGDAGIVHRDVKPENVMLTPKGRVKVADFGLAQLARNERDVQLTQEGMTMGTPLYMSPEQVSGKPVDGRSDLYSFGVTLYHVLAGEPPFRGDAALTIAVKHLNEQAEPLAERRPDLPRELCDLVHRMMAKSPSDRPKDAGEVVEELKQIGRSLGTGTGSRSNWLMRPAGRETSHTTRLAVTFLASCLIVMVVSAALGWWTRPGNPLDTPPTAQRFEKRANVRLQRDDALRAGTAEAWQAVVDHFGNDPDARREVAQAKLKLGVFALADRRVADAERLFDEVRTEFESDPALRSDALVGLAAVESLQGRYAESQNIIVGELDPENVRLGSDMRQLVVQTIARNRSELGASVADGLEDSFRGDEADE